MIKKMIYLCGTKSESSSVGRARPCQGRGRGSESRLSLFFILRIMEAQMAELVDALDLKSSGHCGRAGSIPAPGTYGSSSFDGLFLFL